MNQDPLGGEPVAQIEVALFFPANELYYYNAPQLIAPYIDETFESLIGPLPGLLVGVSGPQFTIFLLLSGIALGYLLVSVVAQLLALCSIFAGYSISLYQKQQMSGQASSLNLHKFRQLISNLQRKRRGEE